MADHLAPIVWGATTALLVALSWIAWKHLERFRLLLPVLASASFFVIVGWFSYREGIIDGCTGAIEAATDSREIPGEHLDLEPCLRQAGPGWAVLLPYLFLLWCLFLWRAQASSGEEDTAASPPEQ